jgi:signal transduction histidine kinase
VDGSQHWVELHARRQAGKNGQVVRLVGTIADVTDRKAIEAAATKNALALAELNETLQEQVQHRTAALMAAEESLRQSQKMEAVGQLTGGIAHDFNNLLAAITGSLELMELRVKQGRIKELDRYLDVAQSASKRAAALTHRLLAFSRRQTLDPKPTDIRSLVADMDDLIRRTVGPHVRVEVINDTHKVCSTLVDPNQLENALLNLCINARDAMPEGGKITIETENRGFDERMARNNDLQPGQYVLLSVSDTGTGMPPHVIERAFDPFFTTKPLGEGTGLGLSMVYGFVRQSGGQAKIYSEVGKGTRICLYLPQFSGEQTNVETLPKTPNPHRAVNGETVLVVDDEPNVRMLVAEVLEELGYASREADDGNAAWKILESKCRIDLLVTDVGLPGGMNGRQLADAALIARPELKILFITGYAENSLLGDGQLKPNMHIVTKPFSLETLSHRIKEIMHPSAMSDFQLH